MIHLRCLRKFYVLCCLTALAACSNGRGSVDSEQPPPPSGGAQGGFTVGGAIAGLDGNGLVLQLNGGGDLAVANDGSFTFTSELADAAAYSVTVLTQPSAPSQTCSTANGNGTIAGADVTNVTVTCATGAFALRGTVSGLAGTGLVLQNNGGDALPISANGAFAFPTPLASGAPYNVTVATQPSGPSQSCSVTNGSGTIGAAAVTNVTVKCATGSFAIGATISGLAGSGLVLQNNGGNDLAVNGNGTFQFSALLASGAAYNVTVKTQPANPAQNCSVTNGSGTVGNASVTSIAVACATDRFTIGGTISGLAGSRLQLRLNSNPPFDVAAGAASFAFPSLVPSGTPYLVRVTRNPSNPSQDCAVTNEAGVVGNANVTNVVISCTTNAFSIGGSIQSLRGAGLVLQKNGADDLAIASDGRYNFATQQPSGSSYQVTVRTQPTNPSQACTIANAGGTVGSGDVRNVDVTCATSSFSIGGTVTGLLGQGLVLSNNGEDLPISADGSFMFPTKVASGAAFNVTVRVQPGNPAQACTVGNNTGTVGAGDVTTAAVNCSTSDFAVGGAVSGLAGTGLVLQNNLGDNLPIDSDGSFMFLTPVPSGVPYSVTVGVQPSGPAQLCTVTNPSGVIADAPVTNVAVDCVTTEFSIGVSVSGLTGSGLVLQNNGTDDLAIAADGSFTFATSLPTGTPYNVAVATPPIAPVQVCTVVNGVGIVDGADVATVAVSCVDLPPI